MTSETNNFISETLRQGKKFKNYQSKIVDNQEKEIKNLMEGFEPNSRASDSSKPVVNQVKYVQNNATQLNQLQTQFASTLERYKTAHAQLMSVTNTYLKDNQKLTSDSILNKNIFVNQVSSNTTAEYVGAYSDRPSGSRDSPMDFQNFGNIPEVYDACKKKATEKGVSYFGLQRLNRGDVVCSTSNDFNQTTKFGAGGNGCILGPDNYQYGNVDTINAVYQTPTSTAKYVGTYVDSPDRAMDLVNGGSNSFSFQTCLNEAIKTKSKYFALQDGSAPGNAQCALSNDWTKASKYGKANNFTVARDGYKYGGGWANSIYEVNTTTPKYLGCYMHKGQLDPSGMKVISTGSSVLECQKKATDSNFTYFGLSGGLLGTLFGSQTCSGGNNLSVITKYGQTNPASYGSDGKIYGLEGVNAVYKFKNTGYPENVGKAGYVDPKGLLTEYPKPMISVVNGVPSIVKLDNSCPKGIVNVDSNVWQNQRKASNMMTTTTKCGLSSAIQADQASVDEMSKQLKNMSAQILSIVKYLETLDDSAIKQMGLNRTSLNDMLSKYTSYNTQFSQYANVDVSNYDNILADRKIVTSQQNYNYILWSGITVVILIIALQLIKRTST